MFAQSKLTFYEYILVECSSTFKVLLSPNALADWPLLTRQPLGPRATRQPLGGHKVAPLYLCDDIVATRRDREAKLFTHLPEYLADVMSKFGVNASRPFEMSYSDVGSQIIDLRLSDSSRYIRYVRPNIEDRLLVRN